jgi:ABC-2 type transport system permease protein
MLLAGVWLLLVIVVPSVMNVAVKSAYPVPSRVELIQAMRVAGDEATRQGSLLLARYLEDHPEMAPPASPGSAAPPDFYALNIAVTEQVERKVQPVLDHFDRQVANQQAMIDRLRYLSPAIVAQSALNDLAGSSTHRYQHFLAQADTFHRQWREFFNPRILRKAKMSAADVGDLPRFRFAEEPSGAVTGRFVIAFLGLLAAVGLVAIPGLAALRRYPVAG